MKQVQFDMRTTKAFYPQKPQKKPTKKQKNNCTKYEKFQELIFQKILGASIGALLAQKLQNELFTIDSN